MSQIKVAQVKDFLKNELEKMNQDHRMKVW